MTDTAITPSSVEIAALRAELAELETENAEASGPTLADLTAAIDKASAAFIAAGQGGVVADLVRAMLPKPTSGRAQNVPLGADGGHRSPAQLAALVPAASRADFLVRLDALVAGLRRGH